MPPLSTNTRPAARWSSTTDHSDDGSRPTKPGAVAVRERMSQPPASWSETENPEGGVGRPSSAATNMKPRPCTVRMTCCALPSSPVAALALLMRLVSADDDTNLLPQTSSMSCSLATNEPASTSNRCRTSNTWGSMWTVTPPCRSSRRPGSSSKSLKRKTWLPPLSSAFPRPHPQWP